MTIKGVTQDNLEVDANLYLKNGNLVGEAEFQFDRTKFDIKYKSSSIFSDLGDKFIYDGIKIRARLIGSLE